MNTAIIILLSSSTLLFIISFFQKDKTAQLETEIDELSMNLLQDYHNLKKRIVILEEELMLEKQIVQPSLRNSVKEDSPAIHEILKNQVIALHHQGVDLKQISAQSALPLDTVSKIIAEAQHSRGMM